MAAWGEAGATRDACRPRGSLVPLLCLAALMAVLGAASVVTAQPCATPPATAQQALAQFYGASGGPSWWRSNNWLGSEPCSVALNATTTLALPPYCCWCAESGACPAPGPVEDRSRGGLCVWGLPTTVL